jgi:membrane protein DedA with SNARE-associated domain
MTLDFFSLETLEAVAQHYGYWAIFLGILLENTGIPLPGETLTLVGGFLAGSGDLQVRWVLLSALFGAIVGDSFGYWIGRRGGWAFVLRMGHLFRIPEESLIQGRENFANNAEKAVILGRFVTLLRILAGPLAGIAEMPYGRFLACNALGALLWVLTTVGIAYFAGQLISLSLLVRWVAQFGALALLAVAIWLGSLIWLERSSSGS